ncbi:hypothetical protein M426DRAFT_258921 [Hypoxylon sp. CI-4A]|nr:hypothetical protein M426DRAFT_258921 [Hypoxylon sp. CI-4A]
MDIGTRLGLVGVVGLLYTIILVIYRIYFQPLAKFPGPKLAAITGWREIYIDHLKSPRGNFMGEIGKMHRQYGPIVRINPNEIHVNDSKWMATLYASSPSAQRDRYLPTGHLLGSPKGVFGTVSHSVHRNRRAALNPLFSKSNAAAAATTMIYDHVDLLLNRMDEHVSRDSFVKMRSSFSAFTTDTVAKYSTGQSKSLLEDEKRSFQWHSDMRVFVEWTMVAKHFFWAIILVLKMPMWALGLLLPSFASFANLQRVHTVPQNLARDAIRNQHLPEDSDKDGLREKIIFETILSNDNLPPSEKVFDRISHEGVVAVIAGGETTLKILATAIYFILSNKSTILSRLEEEIWSAMPDPSSRPSLMELEHLPWLTAVIKESLRIMGLLTTRSSLISPAEPLTYEDWVIPAGTPVSMTMRQVLLDPEIFECPSEFRPERWLATNPNLEELNRYFIPFGHGKRMCIGYHLGYAEIYIALACILRRRKLVLYDTVRERDIDIMRDCFVGEPSRSSKGVRIKYEAVSA